MEHDYASEPVKVGSGTVMLELKEKLFNKYPMTEEEKQAQYFFNVDGYIGKRLVMLAEEYFENKK
ncbi:hypothetical protein [Clostridium butyricum]|uniref:Uncharacterized protein n=1 Tax=Clostridium butyricum TaxID=1492 RepID=A0AAP9RG17_CLOBU|nr:hypothetical protein [Clostridium butyricum]MBZ5747001.1 hypothetical protein [Clostridium butyricum]MDI9207908.1 hypothetical protein [Clostridium butyricum]QMW91899.1 hypothetical protein FF104_13225 [Clostridium butyricum]BBK75877.1 hypothetical protein Cbu04g_08850 [Clostridium butyricum]GEQ27688.1 hypothetical protein CBU03nite_41110 [Clostridium butyricum]